MINPKDPLDRFLMFVPGFTSWVMILMPIWLGFLAPRAAAFLLTFIAVYWVYLAFAHAVGLVRGYLIFKKETAIDWYKKCEELNFDDLPNKESLPDSLKNTKHLILIPTVKESFAILKDTFRALVNSNYPKENILVVVSTEEIGEAEVTEALDQVRKEYGDKLPRIMQFIHPRGIPGEIVGVASPNRKWGAVHAVEALKKEGEDIKNYIFTTYDSDWLLHKEFLPRLTYAYLTDGKRFNRFYETVVHLFSNNVWSVPILSRIESHNITLGMLSNWTSSPLYKESFSCYSCALDTLVAADYWDTTMIDDTVFYWRALYARRGDFSSEKFYIPIYGDATGGTSYLNAHKNLYKQLVRWGWGSVTSVIAMKYMVKTLRRETNIEDKVLWVFSKLERHLLLRTSVFLITFGFSLVTLVNVTFRNSSTVYALPNVLSLILTLTLISFIPVGYVKYKLYEDSRPGGWNLWKKILVYLEGPIIMINLLTFSFIPWLYAETRMMFGEMPKVTFYTPKSR